MSLAVVFLPDTALLVPGAAGRADPAAGLRDAAVAALADLADRTGADGTRSGGPRADDRRADDRRADDRRDDDLRADDRRDDDLRAAEPSADGTGRVLVVAPARRDRFLPHPVAPGLGAAGLDLPGPASVAQGTPRADVPASVALVLLRAAGVSAPVDVLEVDRAADGALAAHLVPDPLRAVVVVGSLSARHGPDAPLADDPRALAADDALLAALADGPAALARALDVLGVAGARDLAVSGRSPWRAALALLPADAIPESTGLHAEVVAGAQHAVVAWRLAPRPPQHPEEPR